MIVFISDIKYLQSVYPVIELHVLQIYVLFFQYLQFNYQIYPLHHFKLIISLVFLLHTRLTKGLTSQAEAASWAIPSSIPICCLIQSNQLNMAVFFRHLVKSDVSVRYCTVAYAGRVTFYKVPEQHGHV